MTEAVVNEHGRTMGCPRCSSAIGIHNAECRGRIETGATQAADKKPPGAPDVEMGAGDPCEAQVKRAKTMMGLERCLLEAQDDVYDETPGTPTNPSETSEENATDEDVVAPEVTEELNRLKTLGRAYKAPSVDELMLLKYVYSQKTNERLDDRMVAEARERAFNAVFTRCAVRDPEDGCASQHLVDDMKNGCVKSRIVAAEVARNVRHDVHAGTPPRVTAGIVRAAYCSTTSWHSGSDTT